MPAGTWLRSCPPSVLLSLALLFTPVDARAQDKPETVGQSDLSSIRVVDALNLFPNVGALIYFAEPNDFGIPPGIVTQCSGTLIHERAFLVAGHCTAATGGTLLPFIKAFVTLSPNALDRSAWREVSGLAYHPSIPPCPPPDFCTFRGLDPGILDIGLVFLRRPVRDITAGEARAAWDTRIGSSCRSAHDRRRLWLSELSSGRESLHRFPSGMDFGASRSPGCGGSSTTSGRAGLCLASCATAIPERPRSFRVVSWSPSRAMAARACASHATIAPVSIQRRRRTGSVRQSRTRSVDTDDRTERRAMMSP